VRDNSTTPISRELDDETRDHDQRRQGCAAPGGLDLGASTKRGRTIGEGRQPERAGAHYLRGPQFAFAHDAFVRFIRAFNPIFKLAAVLRELPNNFDSATPDVTA
jgi:hypothetical protein